MPEPIKNLFNLQVTKNLAEAIHTCHPAFDRSAFLERVFNDQWETLELKERMHHITRCLHSHLPQVYRKAINILDCAAARLEKHGFLDGPLVHDSACIMASYYQFFREVLFALESYGVFVLLCDQRSPTFAYQDGDAQRGLMPFLLSVTPEKLHDKIKVVYIKDVVAAICETGRHEWVEEFEMKYGLG